MPSIAAMFFNPLWPASLPDDFILMAPKGRAAGHNGLKNIAAMLGTQAYPRLRFGIGNDYPRGMQVE